MKKIFLSTLLAVLMLVQMVPMTVLAAETTGDVIKDTITSTSGFTTVERENKNGSKTTVITFDGKSVEITNYENAQVIVEKETNKMPKMTIVVSSKVTDKIMIEVPVNLGKYFKTNWVNVSYLDGNTDFAFAKYDSDNQILSFELGKSAVVNIIDDYIFESPEKPEESEKPDESVDGEGCFVTKRENKNGSTTHVIVTGNKVTEVTNYEKVQVVVTHETGKAPQINVTFAKNVKESKVMVEVPMNLGYFSRAGWLDATYADGKIEYIQGKYDHDNAILSFEIAKSAKLEVVGNFTAEKPVRPETPVEKKFPFTDVNNTDWYYDAVKYVYDNEIMVGVSDVKFAPNEKITRAMVVTMLHRMEGKPITTNKVTFKDVEEDTWYTEAIRWANKAGIVSGYSEDTFGTNDAITREQLIVILYRYAQYKKVDVKLDKDAEKMAFNDNDKIADWVRPAAEWAYANGIVKGANTYFMPKDNATRAMTAAMFQSFITNILK